MPTLFLGAGGLDLSGSGVLSRAGAGQSAQIDQRGDQMSDQVVDVEVGAWRRGVGTTDLPQDRLARRQRRFGCAELVDRIGGQGPLVGAGVSEAGSAGQAFEVSGPNPG